MIHIKSVVLEVEEVVEVLELVLGLGIRRLRLPVRVRKIDFTSQIRMKETRAADVAQICVRVSARKWLAEHRLLIGAA